LHADGNTAKLVAKHLLNDLSRFFLLLVGGGNIHSFRCFIFTSWWRWRLRWRFVAVPPVEKSPFLIEAAGDSTSSGAKEYVVTADSEPIYYAPRTLLPPAATSTNTTVTPTNQYTGATISPTPRCTIPRPAPAARAAPRHHLTIGYTPHHPTPSTCGKSSNTPPSHHRLHATPTTAHLRQEQLVVSSVSEPNPELGG
jgi:hypothetical protein